MIPALVGAMVLLSVLDKPGVEALHGSDILRLLASGAGFGIALAARAIQIRKRVVRQRDRVSLPRFNPMPLARLAVASTTPTG